MTKRVYLRALALLFAILIGGFSASCDINPDGTAGGGGLVDSDKEAYGVSYNNISFITSEAKKEWVHLRRRRQQTPIRSRMQQLVARNRRRNPAPPRKPVRGWLSPQIPHKEEPW